MRLDHRLAAAWRALVGPLPAQCRASAGMLTDGRLVVLASDIGSLVLSRETTQAVRAALAADKARAPRGRP